MLLLIRFEDENEDDDEDENRGMIDNLVLVLVFDNKILKFQLC